ncbi:MAG TPA: GGDEF domain-containing protein [Thermoanaerobaculia bacterium]|nr:GGDEF domain-containing protein [Thermoanaerobaculia bacterium]
MRLRPQLKYPLIGFALGACAPLGALLIRIVALGSVRGEPLQDLSAHAFFYLYQLIGTCLVFAVAGVVAGGRADRLWKAEEFYHRLSEHDSLTGLYNARALTDRCGRGVERAERSGEPLSMMLIDVDRLKALNDGFGHTAGNDALVHVAEVLKSCKRADDAAARWGGDEFAILLEGANALVAMRVAEAIVAQLRTTPLRLARKSVTVTVTIGVCTMTKPSTAVALFAAADRALYEGKEQGRDRISTVSLDE